MCGHSFRFSSVTRLEGRLISIVDTGVAKSNAPVNATVRAGDFVYLVAIPKDPASGALISGDIEAQARRALANLSQAISAAGGSLSDIAQVVVYLTDESDFAGMNKAYVAAFGEPYPSRATVIVKGLMGGIKIELVANAYVPRSGRP